MSTHANANSAAMTAAEFRAIRESLGLPVEWLATELGKTERTVRRWQAGNIPVPDDVAGELYEMRTKTLDVVDYLVDDLRDEEPEPDGSHWLVVDSSMNAWRRPHDAGAWPPGWVRIVLARVMEQVPGCRVQILGEISE